MDHIPKTASVEVRHAVSFARFLTLVTVLSRVIQGVLQACIIPLYGLAVPPVTFRATSFVDPVLESWVSSRSNDTVSLGINGLPTIELAWTKTS